MAQGLTASAMWGFSDAISAKSASRVSQDSIATVSRRDKDGTVWVRFDGASSDTPVSTVLSAVSVGERVRVSVHGGRVTIVGNSTSPGVGIALVGDAIAPTRRLADVSAQLAKEAKLAANSAVSDAGIARSAAESAVRDAATAKEAAESAVQDARVAHVAADEAKTDALGARASATEAKASATRANTAANDALAQLTLVEDVAGTLGWISEHGAFVPTEDAGVAEGTVYYEYDGTDYVPVVPQGDEDPSEEGWYVLDVTESQAEYIMSHVAVTAAGLWVLPNGIGGAGTPDHADGYKMLLANDGAYIYDGDGHVVTMLGESIVLDSERPQHIGGDEAYIVYYDSDDDGVPDSIVIGGERVSIGGRELATVLGEIDDTNTAVEAATEELRGLFDALGGKADGSDLESLEARLADYEADNEDAWEKAYQSFVTEKTLEGYVTATDYDSEITKLRDEVSLGVQKSQLWVGDDEAGEWAWEALVRLTEDSIQQSVSNTYATKDSTEQTRTLSGGIVTADDALAAPPRSLTVYGTSTQDGTPTPEAPVAIESVDELALWVASGVLDEPDQAAGTPTPIGLQGHQLRGLPDGTRDELSVDANGNVTLTQRVGVTTTATTDGISATVGVDAMSTTGTLEDGATVTYRLGSPQTASLGTVALPTLPAPEFTAWPVDATDIELDYWRTAGAVSYENASDIAELSSTVTQQAGSITALFSATGALSTMVRQYGAGVLVCRTGQGIGALVSADGTFDVVSVSWSGGDDPVPTAGEPITSIGGDHSYFGSTSGFRVAIETVGTGDDEHQQLSFYDASNNLVAYMYGGLMYVENTMVLRTMRVGEDDPSTSAVEGWEWAYQDNGNLTLKWIG